MWREKNGFFTALNREGELLTWSLVTGKLIYKLQGCSKEDMSGYSVYRADPDDHTYVRNYYNFEDRTIQLLSQTERGAGATTAELEKVARENKLDKATMNAENISRLGQSLLKGDDDIQVRIRETQIDREIFHFKVIELQTYEDDPT